MVVCGFGAVLIRVLEGNRIDRMSIYTWDLLESLTWCDSATLIQQKVQNSSMRSFGPQDWLSQLASVYARIPKKYNSNASEEMDLQ